MGSRSLEDWYTDASAAFDEIENAHRAVGGAKRGRRFVTQQLNYAYVTLLAARFQGFARALHTQTADVIATGAPTADYEVLILESLTHRRALDRRNAHPDAVTDDFGRFVIDVRVEVDAADRRNPDRRSKLEGLIAWRNAIAHHDIDEKLARGALDPVKVHLATCKGWRSALTGLAGSLDTVVANRCEALGLSRPW